MKRFDVVFDTDAEDDLFDIYAYVAVNDSVVSADKLFAALRSTCETLRTLPQRGNVPPELRVVGVVEFRELRCKPYRILYSIYGSTVNVHCILDGRRDMQTILQERLLR